MSTTLESRPPEYVVLPVKDMIDEFESRTGHLEFRGGNAVNYLADACANVYDNSNGMAPTLNYLFDLTEELASEGAPKEGIDVLHDAIFDMTQELFHRLHAVNVIEHEYAVTEYCFEQVSAGCLILKVDEDALEALNYVRP